MALSDAQLAVLNRRFLLRHRLEQYYVNGYGRMVVSWSTHGIVDVDTEVTARVIVKDINTTTELIDRTFTKEEAFNEHYRVTINEWNLKHRYKVTVTIDDFEKVMFVEPYAGLPGGVSVERFDPRRLEVIVKNTDTGIRFGIQGCAAKFRQNVKNVRIQRCPASLSTPVDKYASAVRIPVDLPTSPWDFQSVLYNGTYLTEDHAFELNEAFQKRQQVAMKVSLIDTGNEWIEITDQEIIDTYHDSKRIDVLTELSVDLHNREDYLYQQFQSDGSIKYYRYRGVTMFIPHQKVSGNVGYETLHTAINYLDPDGDGRAHVHFPLDRRIPAETTLSIQFSFRDRNNNVLEFGGTPVTTAVIGSYLENGVTAMDGFSFHTDTDVTDGNWYYYRVIVETWDNKESIIFDDYVARELISLENFSYLESASLSEPADENSMGEDDLQNGTAPGHLLVQFSEDPEQDRKLALYEKFTESCKCQR